MVVTNGDVHKGEVIMAYNPNQDAYNRRALAALDAMRTGTETKAARGARLPRSSVGDEADRLEAALAAAGLRPSQDDAVWDLWTEKGLRPALDLVVKYKAASAPDPIEQALDRLRQAAQSAGAMAADDQIVAQIDALAAALGRLTTPAGQRMESKMKEAQLGLNPHGLRDDQGRLFGAPVRQAPAVVTTKAADAIGELARQTAPQLYAKKGQKQR